MTFFNQLTVLYILHIVMLTKRHNYITVASAGNLVARYLNIG